MLLQAERLTFHLVDVPELNLDERPLSTQRPQERTVITMSLVGQPTVVRIRDAGFSHTTLSLDDNPVDPRDTSVDVSAFHNLGPGDEFGA